jgi:aspartyl-tRNA(Asn)/glutamyl-tRNA(Gln) amidotransferase subunit C
MPVSHRDLEHLARLSHIGLRPDEIDELCNQVSGVIEHVEELGQVDTDGVPGTGYAVPLDTVLRADEVQPSWPPAAVLANAPQREDDLFRVQAVFE